MLGATNFMEHSWVGKEGVEGFRDEAHDGIPQLGFEYISAPPQSGIFFHSSQLCLNADTSS